jgi:hypothetical protein
MAKLCRQIGREDGAINWKEGCIPLVFVLMIPQVQKGISYHLFSVNQIYL